MDYKNLTHQDEDTNVSMKQTIIAIDQRIASLEDKMNVVLELCLKQNGLAKEVKSALDEIKEEVKSAKLMSMLGRESTGGLQANTGVAAQETPTIPTKCPECGAEHQMQEVKETVRGEDGSILHTDVPAFECQICGEIMFTADSYRYMERS
ncbi:hypothetical protein BVG16_03305 [Paenibacillus selenitireducens]|uniref:Uncharacterized protein n=1 Tax=Paenibacillus selenitireducens TaxID=1324314 RepID=A0A1T2XNA8_9BACL|nr:YgiT-type zinc finger protein [Paenibacillus selenitireducens]OPA81354.1 hypothetical protein BVG16_03305 [Paenibacillus selenitireducens]